MLIAHTEDLGYNSAQVYKVFPATEYPEGSEYELFSGGTVPYPAVSQAYFATSVFDKAWIPGDITSCLTENQVAIYNNMTYTREYPKDPWEVQPGGVIWTEFNQLAAQEADERTRGRRDHGRPVGSLLAERRPGDLVRDRRRATRAGGSRSPAAGSGSRSAYRTTAP